MAFRCSKPKVLLKSRNQRPLTTRFLDVARALADHLPEGTVLDGELVIVAGGRLDFAALQRRMASSSDTHPGCFVTGARTGSLVA